MNSIFFAYLKTRQAASGSNQEQLDNESLAEHLDLTQFQLAKDYNIRPASSVMDQLQRVKKYFVKVKTEISKERKRDAKGDRKSNAALERIVNQTVANNEALERKQKMLDNAKAGRDLLSDDEEENKEDDAAERKR